jgi:hypothetical protein
MAFIGTPLDTRNTFQSLQGKRFNGDGSTTAFTLDVAPSSTLDIEVFVGNVRQDPNSAYTLSGTTLTFTGAPPSGTNNIYVVHQAKAVGTITPGGNTVGVTELNLSDGSNGQFIKTDGSGTLSFASVTTPAVTALNNATVNELVTVGSTTTELDAEANLTFDGSKLAVTNSGSGDSFTVTNSSGAMANDAAAVKINVTDTSDTDNWYGLHILNNGTSKFSITGSGLTTINYLAQNSDVQTNNARSLTTSSDMRLKNDKGLLTDATTKIKQLKPRYFKWKDDDEKNGEDNALQQLGFFSQEVNPILPEAACKVALKDEDGNAILDSEGNQDYSWGLNTRAIVATLVKTVQELEERIKTLEDA